MGRIHYFELCERPELPEWLRSDLFATLGWVQGAFGLKAIFRTKVASLLAGAGARKVIELGCGSGEGLIELARGVRELPSRPAIEFWATDKFPRPDYWRSRFVGVPELNVYEPSVGFEDFDRTAAPLGLENAVLVLSAVFHHVPEHEARALLERAARTGAQVVIVEPLSRSLWGVFVGATVFFPTLLFPLLGPHRGILSRLRAVLDHWVVPLVPLILAHDGVISALRQRTRPEFEALCQGLPLVPEFSANLGVLANFSIVFFKQRKSAP